VQEYVSESMNGSASKALKGSVPEAAFIEARSPASRLRARPKIRDLEESPLLKPFKGSIKKLFSSDSVARNYTP